MIARGDGDEPRQVARVATSLAADGVVGVAASYVDNSGIARVKAVPVARLEDAISHGIGMSPVFDVFMFDDAITAVTKLDRAGRRSAAVPGSRAARRARGSARLGVGAP